MRALWIDEGNDPDYARLAANGIDTPFFSLRDPRVNLPYLNAVKAHAGIAAVGVYSVASWYPNATGAAFARIVNRTLEQVAPGTPADFPLVQLDIEGQGRLEVAADVRGYLLPALREWRAHRPSRVTDLTIEGHKGGLFSPSDVVNVVAKVRFTVPQCYNGAMSEQWDTYAMVADLAAAGFPLAHVCPFYDAAHLPEWWGIPNGYAFTQGRLP